jgi:hypothetical protein
VVSARAISSSASSRFAVVGAVKRLVGDEPGKLLHEALASRTAHVVRRFGQMCDHMVNA